MTSVISRSTIMRLIKDIKEIKKNPLESQGIFYKHDEKNMLNGYAMIIGPKDTPYQYGFYFFKFTFPHDYPLKPPKVDYLTNDGHTRFNPNFYRNTKVCLSVLNTWRGEGWSGCQTISSILLHLCTTLNNTPLLNEPGVSKNHRDYKQYMEIITFKNFEIAILGIIKKNPSIYPDVADNFKEQIKMNYKKNRNDIISLVENLEKRLPGSKIFNTGLYNMKVNVNYSYILKDFNEIL